LSGGTTHGSHSYALLHARILDRRDPTIYASDEIVDGKLYLNLDKDIQKKWEKDIPGYIMKADQESRIRRRRSLRIVGPEHIDIHAGAPRSRR
jgi:hypothetical protein